MKKARGIAKASLDFVDQRIEDLERVIDRFIPYAQTNASVIQSSPVMRRAPKYR